MAKRNRYQQSASKKAMLQQLSSRLETKGDAKHTALETGKDVIVGVLLGGLSAALIGRGSFLVGLGVTGIGHYAGNTLASTLGLGMMAADNLINKTVNGIGEVDGIDGIKDRLTAFKQSMMERTMLDKVFKKQGTVSGTIGSLQYFDYQQMTGPTDNPELYGEFGEMGEPSALDVIERRVLEAGATRLQGAGMGTLAYDVGDIDQEIGELQPEMGELSADAYEIGDVSDHNY